MTGGRFHRADDRLIAESDVLRVVFDSQGAIVGVTNLVTGQELVDPAHAGACCWRLLPQGTTSSVRVPWAADTGYTPVEILPTGLAVELPGPGEAVLRWTTDADGVTVEVRLTFAEDGSLQMWPTVRVAGGTIPPAHLYFPLLAPARLSGGHERDRLVFPAHSGWLIHAPLDKPSADAPYPDGYLGCSIQMMAYYTDQVGGFYLAAHDPHVTHKQLHAGADGIHIRHDAWDLRRGASMDLDYPVVLASLVVGDWYEAADRYRAWALTAPWSARGKNIQRVAEGSRPQWVYDGVGYSIWGTPSSLDWAYAYRWYASLSERPLHIVAGWDWPATRPHFVGKEGWFPARFHPANLEVWKDHYVTPYLNDLFVSVHAPGFLDEWEPHLIYPYVNFSFVLFSEPEVGWVDGDGPTPDPRVVTDIDFFVCPTTEKQADLHAWRDARLVGDYGLDGVFYDISSGNPWAARCLRASHGHTPGWSRDVLRAYAANNGRSRRAMREVMGRPPAQGVEVIVEHVIDDIDFYIARSVAGPMGALEAWTLGPEEPPGGSRDLIPLFQAVYHDIGPVHHDGWVNFERAQGDIFFWICARLALQWGGLLSIHYANRPHERFPGARPRSEVISWDGARHEFTELPEVDESKTSFIRELTASRTGFGARFLAYGRILRPCPIEVPDIELSYRGTIAIYRALVKEGAWSVPQVTHGAWLSADGDAIGLFFCNLSAEDPITVQVPIDTRARWSIDWPEVAVAIEDSHGRRTYDPRRRNDGAWQLELELPPRRITMVELTPA